MRERRYRFLIAALAATLLAIFPLAGLKAQEATPAEPVEKVDAALLEAMKRADELGFQGRYELLAPVLEEAFDFSYMAQISVGQHWQKLTQVQRQEFVEVFSELSIATFASRFDGYSGESFRVGETREGPRGAKLVVNRLVKSNGESVPINFLLREADERWRIVDILLDAKYSELATKRSEYTSVVDSQGFDKLLKLIDSKVAELRSRG